MAFCNACGAAVEAGGKFCNKCGAAMPAAVAAPTVTSSTATTAAPGQPAQGGNAVKIILIVVAVIVGLGILGIGVVSYVGYRIAKGTHIREHNGNVKVETPFGRVESSEDSSEVARDLGDFMYPGSEAVKGGSSMANIAGMHTVSAQLETEDAPDKVAEYYRSKFPDANYTSTQGNTYTIVAGDRSSRNWTTVTITPNDGKTTIQISRVSRS
jgi:hypothetical protein